MTTSSTSRTFRVFISSTFADFQAERDALQERVFKPLKGHCEQRGFRFQPIDLRWGVTEEAGYDQRTADICMEELRRCMTTGLRPALLILLGYRAGWKPLPSCISDSDFSQLREYLHDTNGVSIELLTKWYKIDSNSSPPCWYLQPRSGIFREHGTWTREVEVPLRAALLTSLSECSVSEQLRIAIECSLTEQEIRSALADDKIASSAIAVLRTIDACGPLPEVFRDADSARTHLGDECQERLWGDLSNVLGKHCLRLSATLDGTSVSPSYIDTLCAEVGKRLTLMADAQMESFSAIDDENAEIAAHVVFGRSRGRANRLFAGRDRELNTISEYITGPSTHPLIVVGDQGYGKSGLLARAALNAATEHNHVIVQRYIGSTANSTDARSLLRSLCAEIDHHYGSPDLVPDTYNDLVAALRRRLDTIPQDRPLVVFLDALNQLQHANPQQIASIVPVQIPLSVRFITSATEETGPARAAFVRYFKDRGQDIRNPADYLRMRLPSEAFLECGELSRAAAEELIDDWLANRRRPRCLQPSQRQALLDGFAACPSPLYLRLATEESSHLRSYDLPPRFPTTLRDLCISLFERLSDPECHLPFLVEKTLGYITASSFGLSESELLELLALDSDFMAELKRRADSSGQKISDSARQVPIAVWARFLADIQPYLVEREMDGVLLNDFFHDAMSVAATAWVRDEVWLECQTQLVNFFATQRTWDDSISVQRQKLLSIPPQPRKANSRKLTELPKLLINHKPSRQTLKESIFDPDLLEALCESGRIQELVDTIRVSCRFHQQERISRWNPNFDLSDASLFRLATAVMHYRDFLQKHPTTLYQTLAIFFRFSKQWEDITDFLTKWGSHKDKCTPGHVYLRYVAGPPLHDADTSRTLTFRHSAPVTSLAASPSDSTIACGDNEGGLRAYRVMDGSELWSLKYAETVNVVVYSPSGRKLYIACWEGDSIREIDAMSGAEIRNLGRLGDVPLSLAISADGSFLAAGSGDGCVYLWKLTDGSLMHKLSGHTAAVMSVCFAADGKYCASGGRDDNLILWDTLTGDRVAQTDELGWSVEGLCELSGGLHIASAHAGGIVAVWDVPSLTRVERKQLCHASLNCIAAIPHSQNRIYHMAAIGAMDLVPKWNLPLLPIGSDEELKYGVTDWIVTGADDCCFYLWRPSSDAVEKFMGHSSHVVAVAWDRFSPILCPVSGSHDKTVSIWGYPRLVDNSEHGPGGKHSAVAAVQSEGFGMHFAWCVPDSGLFVSNFIYPHRHEKLLAEERPCCCDFFPWQSEDPVMLVGTELGKLIALSPGSQPRTFDLGVPVRNVRFSPFGRFVGIIMMSGPFARIVVATYPQFEAIAVHPIFLRPGEWLAGIAVHPDGKMMAVGGNDRMVRVFSIEADNEGESSVSHVLTLDTRGQTIVDLEYDSVGDKLVGMTGSVGGRTITWDMKTGSIISEEEGEIHPRAMTSLLSKKHARARCLDTEVVFEILVEEDGSEFRPIAWLPSSMSWMSHDFTGSRWVGLEGQHVCVVELVRSQK